MIDERLLRMNSWVRQEAECVERGRQASREPWGPSAQAALAGYLQGLLTQLAGTTWSEVALAAYCDQVSPTSLNPPSAQNSWPPDLMKEVVGSLRSPEDHQYPEGDWLLGAALFDALIARAQPSDGLNLARLLAPNGTRVLAFADRVAGSSAGELSMVLSAMSVFVQDERTSPEKHLLPGRSDALNPALKEWSAETDLGAVWDTRIWMGLDMLPERVGILTPLAAAKPAEFLALIEELEVFPLIQGSLHWRSITLDMNKVLDLLEQAPVAVDEQSGQWNRKVVAALLLEIAFNQLTQLGTYRQDDGQPLATASELASMARTIIDKALQRPDGVQLIERWMRFQVYRAATGAQDDSFASIFNAALNALASTELAVNQVYSQLSAEYPTSGTLLTQLPDEVGNDRFERLVLAVMLVQERMEKTLGQGDLALRPSFLALMREARIPFAVGFRELMPSWRHHVFSDLYLVEQDPSAAWRSDFDLFSFERRCSVHHAYSDDNSLMAPSLFLSGVALSMIDKYLEQKDGDSPCGPHAMAVWQQLFDATRPFFTHWTLSSDSWRKVAFALFARYPACLKSEAPAVPPQVGVTEWLNLLGGDEALVATAVANLLANGMDLPTIAATPGAADAMKSRMRNFLSWEITSGSRTVALGVVRELEKVVA